jgi:hypothetical protein
MIGKTVEPDTAPLFPFLLIEEVGIIEGKGPRAVLFRKIFPRQMRDQEIDAFGCGQITRLPLVAIIGTDNARITLDQGKRILLGTIKVERPPVLLAKKEIFLVFNMDDGDRPHPFGHFCLLDWLRFLSLSPKGWPTYSFF